MPRTSTRSDRIVRERKWTERRQPAVVTVEATRADDPGLGLPGSNVMATPVAGAPGQTIGGVGNSLTGAAEAILASAQPDTAIQLLERGIELSRRASATLDSMLEKLDSMIARAKQMSVAAEAGMERMPESEQIDLTRR